MKMSENPENTEICKAYLCRYEVLSSWWAGWAGFLGDGVQERISRHFARKVNIKFARMQQCEAALRLLDVHAN